MGQAAKPCGCGGGRPAAGVPAKTARPIAYQFFTFQRPNGTEFASTSWGAFVIAASAADVTTGRTVIREMLGGEVVSERFVGNVSIAPR